jgi:hypothetical protein
MDIDETPLVVVNILRTKFIKQRREYDIHERMNYE